MSAAAEAPAAAPAILETRAARKEFGGLVACNDIDFAVPDRGIVSLIGPNGAGKTTFFNMLTGAYRPTSGEILFAGRDVGGLPPHAITKLGVGRTFQNIRLFQTMTSVENVLVGMHCRLKGGIIRSVLHTPGLKREERKAHDRARELLRYCGLRPGADDEYSMNLSYGDQRRLEVARALGTEQLTHLASYFGEHLPRWPPARDQRQTLQAEAGPQGGHHIWIATRMKNMKQAGPTTKIVGVQPETGATISNEGTISDQTSDALKAAIQEFKRAGLY